MSLEQDKLRLEINELRQKLRWGPVRTWVTAIGVVVLLCGLAVERWNEADRRNFEIRLQLHQFNVAEMTRIASETSGLCQRTASVLREHATIRTFGSLLIGTLRDEISEIKVPINSDKKELIEQVILELEKYEKAFSTELDDYRNWVEGIELAALWEQRKTTPAPSFSLYFGEDLARQWPAIASTIEEEVKGAYAIFANWEYDENIVPTCWKFITKLETRIYNQHLDYRAQQE